MSRAIVVLTTVGSRREADRIAKTLVKEKLAACVNVLPGITSHYRWKGRIEKEKEILLMIKTLSSRYGALEKRLRQLHSYAVPELLALRVVKGNPPYLKWLQDSVR